MNTKEQIDLLQEAAREIRMLRADNQLMKAKLDMFDSCMLLLTAQIHQGHNGVSPDVVWKMEQSIREMEKEAT